MRMLVIFILACSATLYAEMAPQYLATVSGAKTTASPDNDAPGVSLAVLYVEFAATLPNTGDHDIFLSIKPVVSISSEMLSASGVWETMLTISNYELPTETYLRCRRVKPGEKFVFPRLRGTVVVNKETGSVKHSAKVRFFFSNICTSEKSVTHSMDFGTEPIQITY